MRRTLAFRIAFTIGYCCKISITLKTLSMSEMAFHENAGPGQVDFDLSFLKSPFPSWRRVFRAARSGQGRVLCGVANP